MKRKWLAIPLAFVLAGAVLLGSCKETPHDPLVTVQDGYVYVDGKKTDIAVGRNTEEKSAFELWKEENPSYSGTEAEWTEWLVRLVNGDTGEGGGAGGEDEEPQEIMTEYTIVKEGKVHGTVTAGTAKEDKGAAKLSSAVVTLGESVILPLGEGASWEIGIAGKLLTGSASSEQLLVNSPFTDKGRVYLGVHKGNKLLYFGVLVGTTYINLGWEMTSGSVFNEEHTYTLSYEDGAYSLSLDGGNKMPWTTINFNQSKSDWLEGDEAEADMLQRLVRATLGQDFLEFTALGTDGFTCNAELKSLTAKATSHAGYRRLLSHPLAGKKIFYLGSSITVGYASGNVAFGDLIAQISGGSYQKEAVSGTTLVDDCANPADSYVRRLEKFDFSQNPDFLVVQLSTNDFSQNKDPGEVQAGTASSGFDTKKISGAIQYIIAYTKEHCPTCKVVLYAGAVKESWGLRIKYSDYINGDFAKICAKWEIEPLDLFHASFKTFPLFMSDEIHPTLEGYAAAWTPLFVDCLVSQL